ncbi:YihY/virulence factor BrkB family protein, partial [Streptomyces prunicolor]|nr:YihY/virulence factor BrkB family protein [Streptomyces prunicolor]
AAATAAARAANERRQDEQVAEYVARMAAVRTRDGEDDDDPDDSYMPSEFPERWSRFLPPEDVTSRLRTHAKSTHNHKGAGDNSQSPDK